MLTSVTGDRKWSFGFSRRKSASALRSKSGFELLQSGAGGPAIRQVAASLYRAIVVPLHWPASKTKVVIVPDGPLHTSTCL